MQAARPIVRPGYAIVALDEQIRPSLSVLDVSRSDLEIDGLGERGAEAFVENAISNTRDRWLEDMQGRRAVAAAARAHGYAQKFRAYYRELYFPQGDDCCDAMPIAMFAAAAVVFEERRFSYATRLKPPLVDVAEHRRSFHFGFLQTGHESSSKAFRFPVRPGLRARTR